MPSDHGELRRVVNAVLQQIDAFNGPSIIVAATNHSQVLDSALWRRFDAVVEMPLPTSGAIGDPDVIRLPSRCRIGAATPPESDEELQPRPRLFT